MPVLRYFMFVGAALVALLFVVGAELPASPTVEAANAAPDLSTIRIHSDRKWPERVVFDTSAPATVPTPRRPRIWHRPPRRLSNPLMSRPR